MIIRGGGGSSRSALLREPPHHPQRPEHPNHADPTSPVQTFSTASRSVGVGAISRFVRVTLPLFGRGLGAGTALVFLSVVTELTAHCCWPPWVPIRWPPSLELQQQPLLRCGRALRFPHGPQLAARHLPAQQDSRRRPHHMSSPVSSRLLLILREALECTVSSGVVGGAVLPTAPDHEQPGTGEDAHGVRVVVASGSGAVVEVAGPGIGSAGVGREVGDGVAQLFVAGPAEADGADLAGLSG